MSNTYLFAGASSLIAQETAKNLMDKGHQVIGLTTKNSELNYSKVFNVEKYTTEHLPEIQEPINGLVYFPGTINLKPFHRLTQQEFVNDYEINTLGAALVVQKYLPQLKLTKLPSIIFISSVAAQSGMPFHSSISMAKAAIEGLTKALAAELAPIMRVNCVAPSLTNTPLADRLINTDEKMEASNKRHPLKTIGTVKNISDALSFLLSDQSSWITGQVLAVDGGMGTLKI